MTKVKLGVSNRHVHLKKEDLKILFGDDFTLEVERYLNQPGQFASKSKVRIESDSASFDNVRVIGPVRDYTQVEISKTDAYKLKLNPPIRDSGDLNGSETIRIVGPKGSIVANNSVIISNRHIHMTKEDLIKYDLDQNKMYKIKVEGEKGGILDNVHLRVSDNFSFELHLDTDDANAFLLNTGDELEIIR